MCNCILFFENEWTGNVFQIQSLIKGALIVRASEYESRRTNNVATFIHLSLASAAFSSIFWKTEQRN